MKVKAVAKAFGVNVNKFAVMCKCSRQTLYNTIECKYPFNGIRFNAMLDRLQVISDDIYANDILKAMDKKAERDEIIRKLRGNKQGKTPFRLDGAEQVDNTDLTVDVADLMKGGARNE